MRLLRDCAFALVFVCAAYSAWAEDAGPQTTGSLGNVAPAAACPAKSNASGNVLGVSRVVEIDTAGGPGFGSEQFKAYDFLQPGEVVLTFDDGPWPGNTPAVLNALAAQCTKALFFPIGEHAMWHPQLLKEVAAAGHTIGSHTWSHADLAKLPADQAQEEIEKGFSAVRAALGQPEAPFFRFPGLRYSPELVSYLGTRNISTFSADFDSLDFKIHQPDKVIASVMTKLKKNGKGIILMHDFQHGTSLALPEILAQLKANGYRIVQVRAKTPVTTLAQYDDQVGKLFGGASADAKPLSSVVRTIDAPTFNDRFSAVK
ncbi:MAG TPA: polysaccharide deacetylase family protein [Xanthobacteraceae bacterium]|jgi:peptidoglycan/xylan/chitin deacetylase (PgdA/CDA1 family)|nr:polysaccharide deacetylase family protein [Xanthobacteraceae bacterium]